MANKLIRVIGGAIKKYRDMGDNTHAEVVALGAVADSSSDVHAPAANTAAVVTYTGAAGSSHVIAGIAWSYDGAPTGGNLLVEDDSDTVLSLDVTAAGPGFIPFSVPKRATAGNDLVVTLAAGGAGVTGKVSVLAHWTE